MFNLKSKWLAIGLGALVAALPVFAQDSGALIEALVRKGILTNQEAENIRADLMRESAVIPAPAYAGGKSTDRFSVGMRIQTQFANLNTFTEHSAVNPAATSHFFLRRAYLTLKAGLGGDWSTTFTYDFAGSSYDDAIITYKPNPDLSFDFGLRKVNFAMEERGSSSDLRAIERSSVTRYFVEANNGRRLGAGSYRIGVFMDGKKDGIGPDGLGLVYSAAITNPERADTFTIASSAGDSTINNLSYWGNVGLTGKAAGGTWTAGVEAAYMPDQGGPSNTNLGKGFDLKEYGVYANMQFGRFGLISEYLVANVDRGATLLRDASPKGFYIGPSFLVTDKLEAVVKYAHLDTDGRGVNLSDGIRSAPGASTMNKMDEWYAGGNWYFKGNDLKFQLGFTYGKSKDTVTGAPAKAETYGLRSQLQTNF
jgi:phosphate-selective porin